MRSECILRFISRASPVPSESEESRDPIEIACVQGAVVRLSSPRVMTAAWMYFSNASSIDGPKNLEVIPGSARYIATKPTLRKLKERIREISGRSRGRKMVGVFEELRSYLLGWKSYFRLAETPKVFRELDHWLRRRLRMVQLCQWRGVRRIREQLQKRGVPAEVIRPIVGNVGRWWKIANLPGVTKAFPPDYYDRQGVPRLES